MNILEGILYGLLQGITEFLPVSSSGHLSLAQNFFGASESNLTFTVLLHFGTLAAVCAVYYEDIWEMIKGFFTLVPKLFRRKVKGNLTYGEKLFVLVFFATIPLALTVLIKDKVEALSANSIAIGCLLIFNGLILLIADRVGKGVYNVDSLPPIRAFGVGFIQLFAVVPGISRSGATITGGLFAGLDKKNAVKLSFLMSLPAIAGANILEFFDIAENPLPEGSIPALIAGVLAALASGLLAIKLLQYMANNRKMSVFSVYCMAVGVAAIIADLII